MKLIALDTSAEACSAALYVDGDVISRFEHAPRRHTELILPMLEALLAEADLKVTELDAVAFGRGPGSFTGVRIATGVAQGVAFGADLPVVPVSTLAALALRSFRESGERQLLTAFDARMGEVYWAAYRIDEDEMTVCHIDEAVTPPEAVVIPDEGIWQGVGNGWSEYGEVLKQQAGAVLGSVVSDAVCRANEIALLAVPQYQAGDVVSAEAALPVYLRDQVAWKKSKT